MTRIREEEVRDGLTISTVYSDTKYHDASVAKVTILLGIRARYQRYHSNKFVLLKYYRKLYFTTLVSPQNVAIKLVVGKMVQIQTKINTLLHEVIN